MTTFVRRVLVVLAVVALPALSGCGSAASVKSKDFGSDEGNRVAALVDEFNEAKASAAKLAKLFAGMPPADLKRYDPLKFDVEGTPAVSGTTATATVKIRSDVDGSAKGEKEWTFEKDGDKWKVKTAPLP